MLPAYQCTSCSTPSRSSRRAHAQVRLIARVPGFRQVGHRQLTLQQFATPGRTGSSRAGCRSTSSASVSDQRRLHPVDGRIKSRADPRCPTARGTPPATSDTSATRNPRLRPTMFSQSRDWLSWDPGRRAAEASAVVGLAGGLQRMLSGGIYYLDPAYLAGWPGES